MRGVQWRREAAPTQTGFNDESVHTTSLLSALLEDAQRERTSDVHLDPDSGGYQVRLRIDGAVIDTIRLPATEGRRLVRTCEMRDTASARVALDLADAGHLFLSSVHARDAVATITALRNFGPQDFEMAASLDLIVAQRLSRRLPCVTLLPLWPRLTVSSGMNDNCC